MPVSWGCGVQGRTNLEALATLFPLERVYANDIPPGFQARFVEEMSANLELEITGVTEPREAVDERTMAINLGLALDDMAVSPEIYQRARELGIGTWLAL